MGKSIQSKEQLIEAVRFVASETSRLAQKIVGKTFPVKSLTIFAHSQSEYELLAQILGGMGKPYDYNNGPRAELHEPIKVDSNQITHLRIRKPDPERPQVGCNDFETDFRVFKKEYLPKHPENLRLIERSGYDMIELYDSEFNVLAYVVSKYRGIKSKSVIGNK